jgi:hypothetical protein
MENASSSENYLNNMIPQNLETSSGSFIDWIRSITWPMWILFFIILAFLGFNILTVVSKGAADTGSFINIIIDKIKHTGKIINTIKNIIFTSATGSKSIIDTTANAADNILEKVQESTSIQPDINNNNSIPSSAITPSTINPTSTNVTSPPSDISQNNTLNRALNTSVQQLNTGNTDYQADDSLSSIQNGGSKGGWCLIGEDRGFRSCAQVENSNECMSGEIFPTNEICIHPNLRV